MKNYSLVLKTAAGLLLVGALTACGGGGTDTPPVAAAVVPTTFTVAGTAATGTPFAGATVTIIGSDGATYGGGVTDVTGADGSYTIVLPLTAKPPFVVQAATVDQTLVSVVAEAKDTTTNITPVTNLIASRLSTSGDPTKLAAEIQANPALVDATKLTAKVAEIVALIQPLRDAAGDTTDPLNGKLVADGTGADKMLDSLSISITPSTDTAGVASVNIEVAVKQKLADGVSPTVIAFTNTTAPAAAIAAVTAADLVPSGTATLIADLLQRMTVCYALPQAERVSSGGTTAADVIAPACKDIFVGKDPASFKNNGATVSSTGAFSGLFGSSIGSTFDHGSYEFTRDNGDMLISYRATISPDNVLNGTGTLMLRTDTDGKLRAIGNQYKYNGGVNAFHELRTFIEQPAANYYGTGYHLSVNNTLDAAGKPLFAKVVVTSPKGGTLTLMPSAGNSSLTLMKGTIPTRTSFVRIRNVYADAANSGNPADADTTQFSSSTQRTDDEIAASATQSSWQFDYYLASDPATLAATQYYKTRARAMTIAELRTKSFATLADADIATIKANLATNTSGLFLPNRYLPSPATGPITLNWVVSMAALPPTTVTVVGGTTSLRYDDKVSVASSSRTTSIACSPASKADTHCTSSGDFAPGGYSAAQLWASDPAGREFTSLYGFYTITIP